MALGATLKHLRSLAVMLGKDWDLIDDRVLAGPEPVLTIPDLDDFITQARAFLAIRDHCTDDADKLLPAFERLEERIAAFDSAPDEESRFTAVQGFMALRFLNGQAKNWSSAGPMKEIKQHAGELVDAAAGIVGSVLDQCLRLLTRWVGTRVRDSAQQRRRDGDLEFHDLLVLSRDLVRRDGNVRAALHEDYQRLLLDEFQDTDPIQIELATRICGGPAADARNWQDIELPPGRLFVVGDAKQSIYRFRRASIKTYLAAQDIIGERATLSTNFRTVEPILDWVNAVFSRLIRHVPDGQPAYEPLGYARGGIDVGPAVTVLGAVAHQDKPRASALREREAADVAATIRQIVDERWTVEDDGEWRPVRLRDIAVLVPARTSLPFLEEAFDQAGLGYRAEASSLVYQAAEVRALLSTARAVADTSDNLALVTALRSPLFGCGDDDLWRWKQAGGRFAIHAEVDGPLAEGPVGTALAYLRRLSGQARWLTPSELLGVIVADRRMLEVAATGARARDSWRRLRFVVDQARAWSEVSHGGLRAYLAWAARQGQEVARVAEAVLAETDVDAVRVMTIHAAKGLEFPVVILSGMTSRGAKGSGVRLLWPTDGGYEVQLKSAVQTGDFAAAVPVDEQMDAYEKLRLLYVAATRARDHLVVSLHRVEGLKTPTAAKVMADVGAGTAAGAVTFTGHEYVVGAAAIQAISPPPDYEEWLARVELARRRTRMQPAVTASGLEGTEPEVALDADVVAGSAKGARDLELPPWTKGRYGSAVGRAVHAVLQTVDLASGDGLEAAVLAQAMAEGVVTQGALVANLVRSALASDVVTRAAAREHWRETYVGTVRADGTILEGYIDLVFRDDDGTLVVVDYKTDAIPAGALDSRVTYYRPQMEAYVEALSAATGTQVSATLLFLNPAGASVARGV